MHLSSGHFSRRKFLADLAAAGVAVPLSGRLTSAAAADVPSRIENDHFAVGFDARSGRLAAWHKNGKQFVAGSVGRARLADGLRSTNELAYQRVFRKFL
jgi:hypothetical protein